MPTPRAPTPPLWLTSRAATSVAFSCLLAVAALLLSPGGALANWPAEGLVVCQDCDPDQPFIAPDGSGGAYIVWRDVRDASDDVYLQRVTVEGSIAPGWPLSGLPVCTAPESQVDYLVLRDELGGVLVAWTDYRDQTVTGTDIYAQRILPDGSLAPGWQVNGMPVTRLPGIQFAPLVAPDGAGGVFVTWYDLNTSDIYLQHLGPTGEVAPGWPPDGLPISTLPAFQGAPQVVPDGAGGALLAWGDLRDGTRDLYAQRVTAAGQVLWAGDGVRMLTDRAIRAVVADGAGGAYAAGATLGPTFDQHYYLQRFSGAGTLAAGWPANGVAICTAPEERGGLHMVPDGAGGVLIAWGDYRDRFESEVFAARIGADGARLPGWPVDGLRVTDNFQHDNGPDLAPDGQGGAYLCWEREIGAGGPLMVVQHLTGAGTVAAGWPAAGLTLPIAADGAGGAIVTWEHGSGIRAQRLVVDGPVAVALSLVSVVAAPDRVALVWQGAEGAGLSATVERRGEDERWRALAVLEPDGRGRLAFVDRDVRAGSRYGYRLRYRDQGVERLTAETWVDVPAALVLALEGFRPNPAVGPPAVAFTLPDASPARLELLDVGGRRILSREVGSLGPGRHLLRLDQGPPLAPGLYVLRLAQGGRLLIARGAVIR